MTEPEENRSPERPSKASSQPEPQVTGSQTEQSQGRPVIPEIVRKDEDESATLSAHPLLTLLNRIGAGARIASPYVAQYLITENWRTDTELQSERAKSSALNKELHETREDLIRAQEQIKGLQARRKSRDTLFLFGGVLLGLAGLLYSTEWEIAIILAVVDVAMITIGLLLL